MQLTQKDMVLGLAFSSDGKTLASSGGDLLYWDAETGKRLRVVRIKGYSAKARSAIAWQNGVLAVADNDQRALFFDDPAAKLPRNEIKNDQFDFEYVALTSDGTVVATTASCENHATLFDAKSGKKLRTFEHPNMAYDVAFSPDGKLLATGCNDGRARIWDVRTGKLVRELAPKDGAVNVAWSPDDARLLCGGGRTLAVFDASTGKQLAKLGHDKPLEPNTRDDVSAVFSPDGRFIASAGSDGKARIWDARTYACVHTLTGHTERVHVVAFAPDGKTLATGSFDNDIRLWDVESGHPLAPKTKSKVKTAKPRKTSARSQAHA